VAPEEERVGAPGGDGGVLARGGEDGVGEGEEEGEDGRGEGDEETAGELMVTFFRRMLLYLLPEGEHLARGTSGQQMLHGWAAHGLLLSLCCAGPIQIGHCVGLSITMFSKVTSSISPS